MSAFDAQINVIDHTVLVPDEAGQDAFQVVLTLGLVVPLATPQGVQPALTSFGVLRFSLNDRKAAELLADDIRAAAEKLPVRTTIETASNLGEVEEAARRIDAAVKGLVRP